MASSRGKRPSHTVKVAEFQLSSKRVHLTIGFPREGLSSEQREEIRTAVATMLWHGESLRCSRATLGEDERPEAVDEVEEARDEQECAPRTSQDYHTSVMGGVKGKRAQLPPHQGFPFDHHPVAPLPPPSQRGWGQGTGVVF